jgi:four helix bundle protein
MSQTVAADFLYGFSMHGTYEDLNVWRCAMDLVLEVYRATGSFPRQEIYGLTSQMRRSAVSVPSNIAEGKGRFSRKELLQFLFHARGSLLELQTQITIARELDFLPARQSDKLTEMADEVGRLLNGLINRFQDMARDNAAPDLKPLS